MTTFVMLDGHQVQIDDLNDDLKGEMIAKSTMLIMETEMTLEGIQKMYPDQVVQRVQSNLPYSQVKFNEPYDKELP